MRSSTLMATSAPEMRTWISLSSNSWNHCSGITLATPAMKAWHWGPICRRRGIQQHTRLIITVTVVTTGLLHQRKQYDIICIYIYIYIGCSNTHWTLSQGHRRQELWTHLCASSPFSPYLLVEPVVCQKVDELLSVVCSHIDMLASCLQLHQLAVREDRRVYSTAREEQWYISFQRLCVQALAIGVMGYPLCTPQCGRYPTCVSPRSLLTTVKLRASSSTLSYCFINRRCLQWRRQVGGTGGKDALYLSFLQ